jgi:hypothetical protein
MQRHMDTHAIEIIKAFGGLTKLHKLSGIPIGTIAKWQKIGIVESRIGHLRMIAEKEGILIDFDSYNRERAS